MTEAKFPMVFHAIACQVRGDIEERWNTQPTSLEGIAPLAGNGIKALEVSIPAEFGGPNLGFSPEDFYVMALANCFVATFKIFAKNSKLAYSRLDVEAQITIEIPEGKKVPAVTAFALTISLAGVENTDRAEKLLSKVAQNCLLINSVNVQKHFKYKVTSAADAIE